jgi:hypothetical protein
VEKQKSAIHGIERCLKKHPRNGNANPRHFVGFCGAKPLHFQSFIDTISPIHSFTPIFASGSPERPPNEQNL